MKGADEELAFKAAWLLCSWRHKHGFQFIRDFVLRDPPMNEGWYPHRLYGYDDTYRIAMLALTSYLAREADRSPAAGQQARQEVLSPMLRIIGLSNAMPFAIDYFFYLVEDRGFIEYLPALKAHLGHPKRAREASLEGGRLRAGVDEVRSGLCPEDVGGTWQVASRLSKQVIGSMRFASTTLTISCWTAKAQTKTAPSGGKPLHSRVNMVSMNGSASDISASVVPGLDTGCVPPWPPLIFPHRMNFLQRIALSTLLLLLAGCKSVGTQYVQPTAAEPSAVLFGSEGVYVNNFNQEGCYTGRTHVPDSIKLQPGKEVVASFESKSPDRRHLADSLFCRVVLAFTPKQGYSYRVVEHSGTNPGQNLMGQPIEVPVCRVVVEVEGPEGEHSIEPVTQLVLRQKRLACIKAIPVSPGKGSSER